MADLVKWLVEQISARMLVPAETIDLDCPFRDLGLSSREGLELLGDLETRLGISLETSSLWRYPTIAELAAGVGVLAGRTAVPAAPAVEEPLREDRGRRPAPDPAESFAVIGMACRLPGGVESPAQMWEFVRRGGDAIRMVPPERWEAYRRSSSSVAAMVDRTPQRGGFLDDLAGFDAAFFGISPREADRMDPQQRLLLEVVWEALEHGGVPPTSLRGSRTGVFVGAASNGYGRREMEDLAGIDVHSCSGSFAGLLANRISYCLDLYGRSMTVDTACSASLVALDSAVASLRHHEIDLALVGGVNLMVSPATTIQFHQLGALAPDGRCKSFDARADGYGRAEGCGVVLLRRLSDALRDGDRVLAVVRGSAVNQDGRTNGISAPNPYAQVRLIRSACEAAGVSPADLDYVEAHGSGTPLGDRGEAEALGASVGADRDPGAPCLIGSVKTNFGHLEAAAGIVGLMKVVLALQHEELPASLHFESSHPEIDLPGMGLSVVTEPTAWRRGERPRLAGVSAFGFGGTNAHVIVEEAPVGQSRPGGSAADGDPAVQGGPRYVLPLSAASPAALRSAAGRLADWLDTPEGRATPLGDVAHTLAHRRSHLTHRLTAVGSGGEPFLEGLRSFALGGAAPCLVSGPARRHGAPTVVLVFPGQGGQWAGMARGLLGAEPVFAAAVDAMDPAFRSELGFSLRAALASGADLTDLAQLQPVLFGLQVALATLWKSYGITPAAVVGHSMGEVAAAVVAGALTLEDGLAVIGRRARLLGTIAGRGAMAAIELPAAETTQLIADCGVADEVGIAVWSGPSSTVVAGRREAVERFAAFAQAHEAVARVIRVDVASHSPEVDCLLSELKRQLADLAPSSPKLPFYSTVLGNPSDTPTFDAAYWADNLRRPVRFVQAMEAAVQDGHTVFIEVGPHPVLRNAMTEALLVGGVEDPCVLATMSRNRDEALVLREVLGRLHCAGVPVDWRSLAPGGRLADLPTMSWERRHHWREELAASTSIKGHDPSKGSLLGIGHSVAGSRIRVWETALDTVNQPWPEDRSGTGRSTAPPSVVLNTLLQAAAELVGEPGLSDVRLDRPIVVDGPRRLQVVSDHDVLRLAVASGRGLGAGRSVDDRADDWADHATAQVVDGRWPGGGRPAECSALPGVASRVELTDQSGADGDQGWRGALEAALALAPALVDRRLEGAVVTRVERIRAKGLPGAAVDIAVTTSHPVERADGLPDVDISIRSADTDGELTLRGVRFTRSETGVEQSLYGVRWHPVTEGADSGRRPEQLLLLGGDPDTGQSLAAAVGALGGRARWTDTADWEALGGGQGELTVVLLPTAPGRAGHGADDATVTRLLDTLSRRRGPATARLWAATIGVRESRTEQAVSQGELWGLGRTVASEHGARWGGVVDLDPGSGPRGWAADLLAALQVEGADVLAPRSGGLLARRLTRLGGAGGSEPAEGAAARIGCRPDGTYLVVGGLSRGGLRAARGLAAAGARRIVLADAEGLPERSQWGAAHEPELRHRIDTVRELERSGVTVHIAVLDLRRERALLAWPAEWAAAGQPPVAGVVLAADGGPAPYRAVHRAFPPGSLDFLLLAARLSAPSSGPLHREDLRLQAALEALGRFRRGLGCRAVNLSWESSRWSEREPLIPGWRQALSGVDGSVLSLGATAETARGWAFLEVPEPSEAEQEESRPSPRTADDLAFLVRQLIADELRMPSADLDVTVPIMELGMDSAMAVAVSARLQTLLGIPVKPTLLWVHPTVRRLSRFLADSLRGLDQGASPEADGVRGLAAVR